MAAKGYCLLLLVSGRCCLGNLFVDKDQLHLHPDCGNIPQSTVAEEADLANINRIGNANNLNMDIPWLVFLVTKSK